MKNAVLSQTKSTELMDPTIAEHIKVWGRKDSLRFVYSEDIYKRIEKFIVQGITLEIGSGPGFFKSVHKNVISSDILLLENLDIVCNSYILPFCDSSLMNIVGIDVLHHLERPKVFFDECDRVLKPGARLILVEPWISPVSRFVYTFLHKEDCKYVKDPLENPFNCGKNPWEGNSMIPYQLFKKSKINAFQSRWPRLKIMTCEPFSFFTYAATGGFQPYGLKSERIARWLLKIETKLRRILMPLSSFRVLIVVQRS